MQFNDYILNQINLEGIKVVSCDIFDTLVFRKTIEPVDVFEMVGKVAVERQILADHISPIEFKELRIDAQRLARIKKLEVEGHREVTLREIYEEFSASMFSIEKLAKLEFEIEKNTIYLNQNVYSFLKYCKSKDIKVCLLSDMYLNSEQIKEILLHNGADLSVFQDLIVSNEFNVSKFDKGLFPVLLDRYEGIATNKIVHMGDHYVSDFTNAKEFGINAFHYVLDTERTEKYNLEKVKRSRCVGSLFSLRKQLSFNDKYQLKRERFWYDFGATVLGPVFSGFIDKVVYTAKQENIKSVYPIMRDGYIFEKMLELNNEVTGDNLKVKPLFTSRLSTYLGSLAKFDEDIFTELSQSSILTVESVFNRFNILKHPFKKYNEHTFSSTKNIIYNNGISVYDAILEFFFSPNIYEQVNNMINLNRKLLVNYIEQTIDVTEKVMTIDIGYNGTVNESIESAFKLEGKTFESVHFLMINGLKMNKKRLKGIDYRSYIKYQNHREFLMSDSFTSLLLDTLMQGDFGSVTDYRKLENGKVIPKLEETYVEQLNNDIRVVCQEGILNYYQKYLEFKSKEANDIESSSDKMMWLIERFMKYPTRTEAAYLGELYTENTYNFKDHQQLCTLEEEKELKRMGVDDYLIKKRNRINIWPAGVVERVYPYYLSLQLYKQSHDNSIRAMSHIVESLIRKNITECIVYGAGEMGKSLVEMLNTCKIKVLCIVDRNEQLWGSTMEDIEVVSFKKSKEISNHIYVIASQAFVNEIHEFIVNNYTPDKEVTVIDYTGNY